MTLEQLMYELRVAVMGEVTAPVDEEKIQRIFNEYENIIRKNIREIAMETIEAEQIEAENEKANQKYLVKG
jgi:hypothetical protein